MHLCVNEIGSGTVRDYCVLYIRKQGMPAHQQQGAMGTAAS